MCAMLAPIQTFGRHIPITPLLSLTSRRTHTLSETYDNVTFSAFTSDHINMAKAHLLNDFTTRNEPLCYHLSRRNFEFFLEPYIRKGIDEDMSVAAKVGPVFVGIAINNDFTFKESEQFMIELKNRDFLGFDLVFELERELNHDFRHELHDKGIFEHGNVFRVLMIGVDEEFGEHGIGTHLLQESIAKAKAKQYKYVTCACTSGHSKHMVEKCGFECINSIKYDEWEYPKGSGIYPKAGIKHVTGWNEISLMVKKLSDE